MRKPIQIHTLIGPESAKWQGLLLTTVVCSDGSMWERWNDGSWTRLPDVPQDGPTPAPADAAGTLATAAKDVLLAFHDWPEHSTAHANDQRQRALNYLAAAIVAARGRGA